LAGRYGLASNRSQPNSVTEIRYSSRKHHDPRSCHKHPESTKPQVTTLVIGFGTLQGWDYFIRRDPERAMRRIVRQANALGFTVRFDPIQAV
jgi:hypothetical protein